MRQRIHFLLLLLATSTPLMAFHEGGVAGCSGCHVMHETPGGEPVTGELLLGQSPSDLCLSCHADDQGSVLGPNSQSPPPELGAGNFTFLRENNLNDAVDGFTNPIGGHAAGHSIVAPGWGLAPDGRNPVAPGGSFPSHELGCTSCHDPHGTDSFRSLAGVGPVQDGVAHFSYPAPVASGLALNGPPESRTRHSAYREGLSNWCRNCHGLYHDEGGESFEHPVDDFLEREHIDQYNTYQGDPEPGTIAPIGGMFETAYLPEVPLEDPDAQISRPMGATLQSKVVCVSCHRAHATSAPNAGRWDFNVALLAEDGVVSNSYSIPNPFGPSQGTLCTKCHAGGPPVSEFEPLFRRFP